MAYFKTRNHQDVFNRLYKACRNNDLSLISNAEWRAKLQTMSQRDAEDISNRFVTMSINGQSYTSTCVLLASQYSGVDMLKFLARHMSADVRMCDRGLENALHKACRSSVDPTEKVEFIVKNYPSVTGVRTLYGTLPVHIAAKYDKVSCLKILLEYDPMCVNQPTSRGLTPLHVAANFGCKNAIEYLVSRGFTDVNAQDLNGDTAAHHAASHKNMQCLLAIATAATFDATITNITATVLTGS